MLNPPRWSVSSFDSLLSVSKYDAILCLYDSVNYIMDKTSLVDFLYRIRQALKPTGLFLFDICTEYNSKKNFADGSLDEWIGDMRYRRVMRYHHRQMIQENQFYIYKGENKNQVYMEKHLQKIYNIDDVRRFISEAGLELLEETDDIHRWMPREDAIRVHFLCRRK
jgi:hypothetical protein